MTTLEVYEKQKVLYRAALRLPEERRCQDKWHQAQGHHQHFCPSGCEHGVLKADPLREPIILAVGHECWGLRVEGKWVGHTESEESQQDMPEWAKAPTLCCGGTGWQMHGISEETSYWDDRGPGKWALAGFLLPVINALDTEYDGFSVPVADQEDCMVFADAWHEARVDEAYDVLLKLLLRRLAHIT